MSRKSLYRWIPLAVILGLSFILFWQLVFDGRVLYWGAPILQFHPWRRLAVEMIKAGHIPLWNHYLGNGAPLAANLQSAVFYPLNLVYLVFPIERAMGYSVVMHVALAGLFMYLYARTLRLSCFAALVAALSYMFSGFLISRLGFLSMANSTPWLPLLFCLAERLIRNRGFGDTLLLGLILSLQFLAGHVQLWYYGLWALSFYVLCRSWQTREAAGILKVGFLYVLALLIGLGGAAVQFLPTLELALLSQRGDIEYELAMTYSFWPWRLVTLLASDFFGNPAHSDYWGYANYWEDCGYIGVLPLIFAFIALKRWWKEKKGKKGGAIVPFFSLLCFLSLLLALGKNLPLYLLLFRWVPGFSFFQAPARFLYLYTLGATVLAGLGAELLTPSPTLANASRYTITSSLAMLLAAMVTRFAFASVKLTFITALIHFAILLIVSAGLLALRCWIVREAQINGWKALSLAFIAVDLILFGSGLNPTTEPRLYRTPTASGAFLREAGGDVESFRMFAFASFDYDTKFHRYFLFKDFGPEDVDHLLGLRESLIPNQGAIEGLYSANNYDPLQIRRYLDLLEAIEAGPLPVSLPLLSLMNVKYILNDEPLPDLEMVFDDGVQIYGNDGVLPRAYIVPEARVIPDDRRLLAELKSPTFNPYREVLLETSPQDPIAFPSQPAVSGVPFACDQSLHYSPNQVKIETRLTGDGYLVLSDTYYPGWRAYVDDQEVEILRANYAFKAVPLRAGTHTVRFEYAPLSFRLGLVISLIIWGAAGLGLILLR